MNRRAAVLAMLALPFGARRGSAARVVRIQEPWTPLFNGKDLAGWETWLGKPHRLIDVPGLQRNEQGEYLQPVGLNTESGRVFSVVQADGAAAIRISGEIYGGLITREEYENYHLRFDFKWGEKRWPPREQAVRDSGCCYHSVGPHDASYGFWMKSFEFQIQEADCGDFYSLAGVIADVEAVLKDPANPKSDLLYRKGSPKVLGTTKRIVKASDHERPRGEWNSMELYCLGQTSVHVVNGKPNMILTGLRHRVDSREVPLTKGRIQFQSEAAEVFYRNIAIRRITEIPNQVLE
jgi:Domain of Unknown Function (DUF1080)